jgi:sugar lactone lactonase YvrE
MSELRAVALAPSGDLYALDRPSATVLKLGPDGKVVQSTNVREGDETDASAVDVRALAVGPDGQLFVLDSSRSLIYEVAADGRRGGTIALPGGYFPGGITIEEKGFLFVADTGLSRIVRLRPDGTGFAEIGRDAEGEAKLDQPTSVAVGSDGEIFVADVGHARVAVFGPDLAFRRQWAVPRSGTLQGMQLAIGSDGLFASDPEGGRVIRYDRQGRQLAEIGVGELTRPVGLAVDGEGNLYVADVAARAIFRYSVR